MLIIDRPVTTSKLENDPTDDVVTGNDDKNDDNNVDDYVSDGAPDDCSSGDLSDSDDISTYSATTPKYGEPAALGINSYYCK